MFGLLKSPKYGQFTTKCEVLPVVIIRFFAQRLGAAKAL
jgi:hypothetical protein